MPDLRATTPASRVPVVVTSAPRASRFILRGEAAIAALSGVMDLPLDPHRSTSAGTRTVLWLGPDEWLLIDETDAASETHVAALTPVLSGVPHSLVDVSDRQIGLTLIGPGAADALAMFVPLDLAAEAFPVGMATRTVFEKAEIMLWRRAEDHFQIDVWCSFAPYVTALLGHAQEELSASASSRP